MLKQSIIQQLLKETPEKIGCYLFKNRENNIIYVGKAKNLKKRINQHFQNKNNKALIMLNEIKKWEIFLTNNEKEAFILEHNLIKKHYPKYNVLLTDDKSYPYIFINKKSTNPFYQLVWKKRNYPGIHYGPFPNNYDSQEILKFLETTFPLWKCQKKERKPCFYYHLKQCSGACFQKIEKSYYQQIIKKVQQFFRGKVKNIKKELEKKIAQASAKMQFEQAQRWQNNIKKIDYFIEKQTVEFNNYLDCDFVNFAIEEEKIVIVIFFYRQGKLQLKKENYFSLYNNNIAETLENFLQEIYTYHPLPKFLVLPKHIHLPFLEATYHLTILHPQKGKKLKILNLIALNAQNLLTSQAVQDFQKRKINTLQELKKIIGKKRTIKTIEFLDISYWDQKIIVAGFSHYLNGNAVFKKNKIYQLQPTEYHEKKFFETAIIKHYQHYSLPDLIILDGNILQLQGAEKGLEKLKKKTSIICLTKNKKHKTEYIYTTQYQKIALQKKHNLLLFLEKIQTNGHLYVIKNLHKYHKLTNKFN